MTVEQTLRTTLHAVLQLGHDIIEMMEHKELDEKAATELFLSVTQVLDALRDLRHRASEHPENYRRFAAPGIIDPKPSDQ